jgi:hypothetical protein
MLHFQLFRIKVYPAAQRELFDAERTRSEMLRRLTILVCTFDWVACLARN